MYRKCIRLCTDKTFMPFKSYVTSNAVTKEKWDLLAAVCLERKPVITPPPNELEEKFQKFLSDLEFERSLKSDHEKRHEVELKQLELLKKGEIEQDIDMTFKNTAQDFADACAEELAKFQPASVITEDDKTENIRSINRKLTKHLVLLVNQKIGNKNLYLLPQGLRQDGETLKQTAERVLREKCGGDIKVQFYGNAPSGIYKYKYSKKLRDELGVVGAKLFFYIARYNAGQVSEKGVDYKWLDRAELENELPSDYSSSVTQFLVDER